MVNKAFRDNGNWAILGDSFAYNTSSLGLVAVLKMKDRMVGKFGYGGYRCDQLIGEIATVKNSGAKRCIVLCGPNDVMQGTSYTTFYSSVLSLCSGLIANGIQPEMVYIAPNDQYPENVYKLNVAMFKASSTLGVSCHSVWDGYFDLDGTWITGASEDGTHPTCIVHGIAGTRLSESILRGISTAPYPQSNVGGLLTNGMFNGTALAIDWNAFGSSTNTVEATTTNGFWQKLDATDYSGVFVDFASTVGKKYHISVGSYIGDIPVFCSVKIRWNGVDGDIALLENYESPGEVRFTGEVVCPVGAESGKIILTAGGSPWMGTYSSFGVIKFKEAQVIEID